MQTVTINVPFEAKLETDSNNYSYVEHPHVNASCYASAGKARAKFKKELTQRVNEALEQVKNYTQRAIGTKQGEVFLIYFKYGNWHYSIVGPDRKHGGSCSSKKSLEETEASAKRHINDAFGGIAWECSY